MGRYDYEVFEAPKGNVQRRGIPGGFFSALRLVLATGLIYYAVYFFCIHLFPFLKEALNFLLLIRSGKEVQPLPVDPALVKAAVLTLLMCLSGALLSPILAWRWTLRYLHGAALSVLLTSYLTQRGPEFYPLLILFVLSLLKIGFNRKLVLPQSAIERFLYRTMNFCLLFLAIANLITLVCFALMSRLGTVMKFNEQRVNDLPSIP